VKHLFVTVDFGPDRGGMARRHVELARRFANGVEEMRVSTVSLEGSAEFDRNETYSIYRQAFHFNEAHIFKHQVEWARWLVNHVRREHIDVIHCGNIRPVGYAVRWASMRTRVPYLLYVNGGDLLREQRKMKNALKRITARSIFGNASGIVATSRWVAELTGEVVLQAGIRAVPPVGAFDLGTDAASFTPSRDTGALRTRWDVGDAPLMLTVARLVPHKGQDIAIAALARLRDEFPDLRYVIVGEGHDRSRLRALAQQHGVEDRVIFAGPLSEAELPEAYATSNLYVGLSRVDNKVNVEGFGISFLEAASSGLPVVAGDSGGVRSAVRHGETGVVVEPIDVDAAVAAIAGLLRDPARHHSFSTAGRKAVEKHYNWDRVARDTRQFAIDVTRRAK
jgi:phosphatidylinositol alpha-1,6-mannosyltransferase